MSLQECQHITGGNPNIVMVFPKSSFSYSSGRITTFSRKDLETPVTRHFCDKCGTAIETESPSRPNSMIVKCWDPETIQAHLRQKLRYSPAICSLTIICQVACPVFTKDRPRSKLICFLAFMFQRRCKTKFQ